MGEKVSTIILEVDLDCHRCYKKISKTVCMLQERVNIQSIAFDEKNNTVTISGPFDPHKLCKKLCCKASNVIKDIQIREQNNQKSKEPAQPKDKPTDIKPTEPVEPKKDKPKDIKPSEPVEPKKDKPQDGKPVESGEPKEDKPKDDAKPSEPTKDKPKDSEPKKDQPKALEPCPVKTDPVLVNQEPKFQSEPVFVDQGPKFVYEPVWTESGCSCGCPYDLYYGENMCCWCGRRYDCLPPVVYGASVYCGYKTCNFFCEEDPQSCSIM